MRLDIRPNNDGWISDGRGNHVKLNAITAIAVESDYRTYQTIIHFGTGSMCVHSEWSDNGMGRDECQKVADDLFKLIQGADDEHDKYTCKRTTAFR